jgi:hypothetical protein
MIIQLQSIFFSRSLARGSSAPEGPIGFELRGGVRHFHLTRAEFFQNSAKLKVIDLEPLLAKSISHPLQRMDGRTIPATSNAFSLSCTFTPIAFIVS